MPTPEGPIDGQELLPPDLLPQRLDLGLAAEEVRRVRLREREKPRIGALLARPRSPRDVRPRRFPRLPAEGVAEAVDRPDEPRVPRVVLQRLADAVHHHGQGRLGNEGLRPDHVADLGPGERPRPALQRAGSGARRPSAPAGQARPTRRSCRRSWSSSKSPNQNDMALARTGGKETLTPSECFPKGRRPPSRTQGLDAWPGGSRRKESRHVTPREVVSLRRPPAGRFRAGGALRRTGRGAEFPRDPRHGPRGPRHHQRAPGRPAQAREPRLPAAPGRLHRP